MRQAAKSGNDLIHALTRISGATCADAVPTAPLEPNSVWLVLRKKQEVVFMLLG